MRAKTNQHTSTRITGIKVHDDNDSVDVNENVYMKKYSKKVKNQMKIGRKINSEKFKKRKSHTTEDSIPPSTTTITSSHYDNTGRVSTATDLDSSRPKHSQTTKGHNRIRKVIYIVA